MGSEKYNDPEYIALMIENQKLYEEEQRRETEAAYRELERIKRQRRRGRRK